MTNDNRNHQSPANLPIHVGPPDQTAIVSYSDRGSESYEDPDNLSFLYGAVTRRFLESVTFREDDRFVLDIGCGTGFAFDVLRERFLANDMVGIGVDPAKGMLGFARDKYRKVSRFRFVGGAFEGVPLPDGSADRVISTLALHWVKDLDRAAQEIRRVLKDDGRVDILMVANEDGFVFKKAILAALRKHLTFSQVLKAAGLVQRLRPEQLDDIFRPHFEGFDVVATELREVAEGSLDDHITWWKARSAPVIAEVEEAERFMDDLKDELRKLAKGERISFDAAFLTLRITPRDTRAGKRSW